MKIIKAMVSTLVVLGIGTGIAYAIYLSNVASISNTTVSTAEAAIKLCDMTNGTQWTNTLASPAQFNGLVPGQIIDIFNEHAIYVGNDNGELGVANNMTGCNGYSPLVARSHSSVALQIVPSLLYENDKCAASLADEFKVRMVVDGVDSGYKSLSVWRNNSEAFGPVMQPNQTHKVQAYAQLDTYATTQSATCGFNINLTGRQAI